MVSANWALPSNLTGSSVTPRNSTAQTAVPTRTTPQAGSSSHVPIYTATPLAFHRISSRVQPPALPLGPHTLPLSRASSCPSARRLALHALPQRPSIQATSTDLLIQRLDRTDTVHTTLKLLRQHRGSASDTLVYLAVMRTLARCLAAPGSGARPGGSKPSSIPESDWEETQAGIRDMVAVLHARRGILSFAVLADLLSSLCVLIPAVNWPIRTELLAELLAALPPAATAAAAAAAETLPLRDVCSAFRTHLRLVQMTTAVESRKAKLPPAVPAGAQAYIAAEVVGNGSGDLAKRMRRMDLGSLADAVELAVLYDVGVSQPFLDSSVHHVNRILARVSQSQESGSDSKSGNRKSADKAGGQAQAAAPVAESKEGRDPKAKSRDRAPSAATAAGSSRRSSSSSTSSPPLDVPALARLVQRWCDTKSGRGCPDDAWLVRTAEVVLLSQDPAAAAKLAAAREQLAKLGPRLEQLRKELETAREVMQKAKRRARESKGDDEDSGSGSGGGWSERETRGKGRGKGRGQNQARGEEAGAGMGKSGGGGGGGAASATAEPAEAAASGRGAGGKGSKNAERRQQRGGASGAPASGSQPTPPAAPEPDEVAAAASEVQRLSAEVAEAEAKVAAAQADLEGLGALAGLPALPRVDTTSLVYLLVSLARRVGHRTGSRVGLLVEAVVAARCEELQPGQAVATLAAIARLGLAPTRKLVESILQQLEPALTSLQPNDAVLLFDALRKLRYEPTPTSSPGADKVLSALGRGVLKSAAEPSTAVVLQLIRTCSDWKVPFPLALLPDLERLVEARVLWSLPLDDFKQLSKERLPVNRVKTYVPREVDAEILVMQSELLTGVVLPLARLRQGFSNPDIYSVVLWQFKKEDYARLEERSAALLLDSFALNRSWALVPQLREALEDFLVAALQLPFAQANDLGPLLLAAGRAMRVMSDKRQRLAGQPVLDCMPEKVSRLVKPAAGRLLELQPAASDVACAVQGLFVELQWRGPGGDRVAARQLLVRMLEAATPTLAACGTSGYAYLLAACKSMGHRPPVDWMVRYHEDAAASLNRRDVPADAITGILNALSEFDSTAVEEAAGKMAAALARDNAPSSETTASTATAATTAAATDSAGSGMAEDTSGGGEVASGGGGGAVDDGAAGGVGAVAEADVLDTGSYGQLRAALTDPAYRGARGQLVRALSECLLRKPALTVLLAKPDALTQSVRQLAVLGLEAPAEWLEQYTELVQGLVPKLSPAGLAYAVEGLALLRAAPPAVFLEVVLAQVERLGLQDFDVQLLGVLLGGAHRLRLNMLAASGSRRRQGRPLGNPRPRQRQLRGQGQGQNMQAVPLEASPLSRAAMTTWKRAQSIVVSMSGMRRADLRLYQPAQLGLVVSAILSHELAQPLRESAQAAVVVAGEGGGEKEYFARVNKEWMLACVRSLLTSRIISARLTGGVSLPSADMLLDLLRLVRRIPQGGQPDTLSEPTLDYFRASLADLAQAAGKPAAGVGRLHRELSLADWTKLLVVALQEDLRPGELELTVYSRLLYEGFAAAVGETAELAELEAEATAAEEGGKPVQAEASRSSDSLSYAMLRDAWSGMAEGLRQVLFRALPGAPSSGPLQWILRELSQPGPELGPTIQAGSLSELALLSCFAFQSCSSATLVDSGWWAGLEQELTRRLRLEPRGSAVKVEAAVMGGGVRPPAWGERPPGSALAGPAGGAPQSGSLSPTTKAQLLVDLAGVCYHLEASGGCDVPREADAMLRRLLGRACGDASSPAAISGGDDDGSDPTSQRLEDALSRHPHPVMAALHVLWVARRLGLLHKVPASVWDRACGHGGRGRYPLSRILRPSQLRQLVLLLTDCGREGKVVRRPQDFTTELMAGLARALPGMQQEQQQQSEGVVVDAKCAAWAVAYCVPESHGDSVELAVRQLADAAVPAVTSDLPLRDVAAFLKSLDGALSSAMEVSVLEALVERLVRPTAPAGLSAGGSGVPAAAEGAAGGSELWLLSPALAFELTESLLRRAPTASRAAPACSRLLAALLPTAETELYLMALPEAMARTVLAAGLGAAVSATTTVFRPMSAEAAACSAVGAAAAAAAAVESLVQLWAAKSPAPQGHSTSAQAVSGQQAAGAGAGAGTVAVAVADANASQEQSRRCRQQHPGATGPPSSAPSGDVLGSIPPQVLANLAGAIISLSPADDPLPHPAAAVLVRLLHCDAVLAALAPEEAYHALDRRLRGSGLPLTEALECQLQARLQAARREAGRLGCSTVIRRATGSSLVVQRAVMEAAEAGKLDGLKTNKEAVQLLEELVQCGVREQLAVPLRPRLERDVGTSVRKLIGGEELEDDAPDSVGRGLQPRGENLGKDSILEGALPPEMHLQDGTSDGPFASLLTSTILKQLAGSIGPADMSLRLLARMVRACAVLKELLQGAWGFMFTRHLYVVLNRTLLSKGIDHTLDREVLESPEVVEELLWACYQIGGQTCNAALFRTAVMVEKANQTTVTATMKPAGDDKNITLIVKQFGQERLGGELNPYDVETTMDVRGERTEAEMAVLSSALACDSSFGPFLIHGRTCSELAEPVIRLLRRHAEAVRELGQRQQTQAGARGKSWAALPRPKVEGYAILRSKIVKSVNELAGVEELNTLESGLPVPDFGAVEGRPLPDDRRLLTARQLGLLYAMMALGWSVDDQPWTLQGLACTQALRVYFLHSLNYLLLRDDLDPWVHLDAVLDVVEPLVHGNFERLPTELRGGNFPFELMLCVPLVRLMAESRTADDEPFTEREDARGRLVADRLLVQSPNEVTVETLLEGLYLPQQRMADEAQAAQPPAGRTPVDPRAERSATSSSTSSGGSGSSGTKGRLAQSAWALRRMLMLPESLAVPDGRRHSLYGDPAADAAREAYIRSVGAPRVLTARRLGRLLAISERALTLETLLKRFGVTLGRGGRWAILLGLAISPSVTTLQARSLLAGERPVITVVGGGQGAVAAAAALAASAPGMGGEQSAASWLAAQMLGGMSVEQQQQPTEDENVGGGTLKRFLQSMMGYNSGSTGAASPDTNANLAARLEGLTKNAKVEFEFNVQKVDDHIEEENEEEGEEGEGEAEEQEGDSSEELLDANTAWVPDDTLWAPSSEAPRGTADQAFRVAAAAALAPGVGVPAAGAGALGGSILGPSGETPRQDPEPRPRSSPSAATTPVVAAQAVTPTAAAQTPAAARGAVPSPPAPASTDGPGSANPFSVLEDFKRKLEELKAEDKDGDGGWGPDQIGGSAGAATGVMGASQATDSKPRLSSVPEKRDAAAGADMGGQPASPVLAVGQPKFPVGSQQPGPEQAAPEQQQQQQQQQARLQLSPHLKVIPMAAKQPQAEPQAGSGKADGEGMQQLFMAAGGMWQAATGLGASLGQQRGPQGAEQDKGRADKTAEKTEIEGKADKEAKPTAPVSGNTDEPVSNPVSNAVVQLLGRLFGAVESGPGADQDRSRPTITLRWLDGDRGNANADESARKRKGKGKGFGNTSGGGFGQAKPRRKR